FFQAEDGIRDDLVTGVQTCALPISAWSSRNLLGKPKAFGRQRPLCILNSPESSTRFQGERVRSFIQSPTTRHPTSDCRVSFTTPDRKSTRLNSSHQIISYAVFCLKQ